MSRNVTIREAVDVLGLSDDTIRRRLHAGLLAGEKKDTPQGFVWYVSLPDDERENDAEEPPQTPPQLGTQPHPHADMTEVVAILREQLTMKDEQITSQARLIESQVQIIGDMQREHGREIEQLHILLQTAQRLIPSVASDAFEKREEVTDDGPSYSQSYDTSKRSQDSEVFEQKPPVSWWRRFFLGEM